MILNQFGIKLLSKVNQSDELTIGKPFLKYVKQTTKFDPDWFI